MIEAYTGYELSQYEDGKPRVCNFQAGMFWCQHRTLFEVFRPEHGGMGWICENCKHFHPSKEAYLKNLLFNKE